MNTFFLYAVVAVIIVVFVTLHFSGNKKDAGVSVIPKMPKFGSKVKNATQKNDQHDCELSFTPDQFAFLIHVNGLYLITDDMLEKYPNLSNCRMADGCPCLSSAALWCLYCLRNGEVQNRKLLSRLAVRILISFPDISEATKRALDYYGDYPEETYDGLMKIAGNNTYFVDVCIVTQWLFTELTMGKSESNENLLREIASQIKYWFDRLPSLDMIK